MASHLPMGFAGFQTLIGYVDVKSSPVYFYVQRRDNYNKTRTPIPFDYERLNVGGAMNLTSGKFTAPQDGTYAFSFTGMAWFPASSSRVLLGVAMHLNGNWIESGLADEAGTADQYETLSFQSTLNLKKGDEIWLEISHMSTRAYLRGTYFTHFSGFLLEENLSQSFSDLWPWPSYIIHKIRRMFSINEFVFLCADRLLFFIPEDSSSSFIFFLFSRFFCFTGYQAERFPSTQFSSTASIPLNYNSFSHLIKLRNFDTLLRHIKQMLS